MLILDQNDIGPKWHITREIKVMGNFTHVDIRYEWKWEVLTKFQTFVVFVTQCCGEKAMTWEQLYNI
jgi:hypothetical protein